MDKYPIFSTNYVKKVMLFMALIFFTQHIKLM